MPQRVKNERADLGSRADPEATTFDLPPVGVTSNAPTPMPQRVKNERAGPGSRADPEATTFDLPPVGVTSNAPTPRPQRVKNERADLGSRADPTDINIGSIMSSGSVLRWPVP